MNTDVGRNRWPGIRQYCTVVALAACAAATAPPAGAAAAAQTTIWDGVYTDAQAKRGREVYTTYCASCHKEDLLGSDLTWAAPLVGEAFTQRWRQKTLYEGYERIRKQMPPDGTTLTAQEYTDLLSFLLSANKYPAGQTELPGDSEKLKQILVQEIAPRN